MAKKKITEIVADMLQEFLQQEGYELYNIEKFEKKLEKFGYEFLPHTNRDFTKIVLKKNSINSTTLAKIINEKLL